MDKANKAILAIAIIGISVYLGFSPLYEKVQGGVAGAVIGASFGAIFVVILTNYLLTKQTEVEQESKRSERVFEEKVSLYKQILLATEKMLEDGVIKGTEEMKSLPFLMLRLQMLGNDEAIMSYQKIYHDTFDYIYVFTDEPLDSYNIENIKSFILFVNKDIPVIIDSEIENETKQQDAEQYDVFYFSKQGQKYYGIRNTQYFEEF